MKKALIRALSVSPGLMIGSRVWQKTSPAQFVRQVRQEISRISWASRRETGLATVTVFAMATISAIFFLLVDAVLSNVVQFLLGFGS
jgi:preprotein translocase subunit SecE